VRLDWKELSGTLTRGSHKRNAAALTSLPCGSRLLELNNSKPWDEPRYMDLFHAITQNIESVLTCHWLGDFKSFKMPGTDKLMDTEPGGESTQYVKMSRCILIQD
jgi:hypothetical protein